MNARRIPMPWAALAALALVVAPASADGPDRSKPPALGGPPALKVPPVQVQKLGNGLELAVVEMHEVPVVDVTLLVGAGSARDPQESPGLATFTAGMLDEGAGRRTALEIAEEAEFLGADFSTSASIENAYLRLHVPKRQLPAGLDLLADVVLRPAFPDSEVTRQRELRRTALLQLRDQPTAMAPLAFHAIVFGATHPYGRPQQGTEAATEALSRAQVTEFYGRHYRPNNARLLVVGDVTPAEARKLVEARFGAWKQADVQAPPTAEPPAREARTIYLVDKPGAAQSVIMIGHPGVARSTPDYFPLRVMNTILGGSFTSRLNQNLRETHGYTYGARSSFDMYRLAGPFRASASVVTAKTDSAMIEFMRELRGIRDAGVPAEELAKAKAYVALGLPGQFETTQDAGMQYLELLANGLPLDYWSSFIPGVQAVTAEDVQRVARQYTDPDKFAIVIVGDRKEIEPGLRALNLGAIEVRDLWGNPAQ